MTDPFDEFLRMAAELRSLRRSTKTADLLYSKEAYEGHWSKVKDSITESIAAGEDLPTILSSLRPRPQMTRKSRSPAMLSITKSLGFDVDGARPTIRPTAVNGYFVPSANIEPMYEILKVARESKYIVELGAGPGWNLLDLCIWLGRKIREKVFYGLEYASSGVETINFVSQSFNLPILGHQFNFMDPDISYIPDNESALIFTHHSIEQVENISKKLYDQILERKSTTHVIHVEPIGWQRFPEIIDARKNNDEVFFQALNVKKNSLLDTSFAAAAFSALHSWKVHYNINALSLIDEFKKHANVHEIERVIDFNHSYNANPFNASTYIRLRYDPVCSPP